MGVILYKLNTPYDLKASELPFHSHLVVHSFPPPYGELPFTKLHWLANISGAKVCQWLSLTTKDVPPDLCPCTVNHSVWFVFPWLLKLMRDPGRINEKTRFGFKLQGIGFCLKVHLLLVEFVPCWQSKAEEYKVRLIRWDGRDETEIWLLPYTWMETRV